MKVRIVCFEDNPADERRIQRIFGRSRPGGIRYEAEFLFFRDPDTEWSITEQRARQIGEFVPDFAIVDLLADRHGSPDGLRVIRQLREAGATQELPVVVWSVALRNSAEGQKLFQQVRDLGAVPIFKNRHNLPAPERLVRASGRHDLLIK